MFFEPIHTVGRIGKGGQHLWMTGFYLPIVRWGVSVHCFGTFVQSDDDPRSLRDAFSGGKTYGFLGKNYWISLWPLGYLTLNKYLWFKRAGT